MIIVSLGLPAVFGYNSVCGVLRGMYWALKVENVKKENDIQTYKEIVAFSEGKDWTKYRSSEKSENDHIKIY